MSSVTCFSEHAHWMFREADEVKAGDFDTFNDRGRFDSRLGRQCSSQLIPDKLTVDNTVPNPSLLRRLK